MGDNFLKRPINSGEKGERRSLKPFLMNGKRKRAWTMLYARSPYERALTPNVDTVSKVKINIADKPARDESPTIKYLHKAFPTAPAMIDKTWNGTLMHWILSSSFARIFPRWSNPGFSQSMKGWLKENTIPAMRVKMKREGVRKLLKTSHISSIPPLSKEDTKAGISTIDIDPPKIVITNCGMVEETKKESRSTPAPNVAPMRI
jgi:hypothetical protein